MFHTFSLFSNTERGRFQRRTIGLNKVE